MSTDKKERERHVDISGGKVVIADSVSYIDFGDKRYPRPAEHLRYRAINFVGREEYIKNLLPLLEQSEKIAIYAIRGMGGIGKTALAAELAYFLDDEERFPGGVLWANLGSDSPADVALHWLENFGYDVSSLDEATRLQRLSSVLAEYNALLILDNAQDTTSVEKLLIKNANIPIVITTRKQRSIPLGVKSVNLEQMELPDAIDLLRSFVTDEQIDNNLQVAEEICNLCGFLPLAITIAGSQLQFSEKWANIRSYYDKLNTRRLEMLSTGEDYSDNVVITFDVSYDELNSELKTAFDSLALFSGATFSLELFSGIQDISLHEAELILDRLVELSLVNRAGARFRLHDLLKDYARNKIEFRTSDERTIWIKRALDYFSNFTEKNVTNYSLMDIERSNIVGITEYEVKDDELILPLVNIAKNMTEYLKVRGLWTEAISMGKKAFELAKKINAKESQAILATRNLSWVSYFHGDIDQAKYWSNVGIKLYEELGQELDGAYAARRYGMTLIDVREYDEAKETLEKALKIFRKLDKLNKVGDTLTIIGYLERKRGNFTVAKKYLDQALSIVTDIKDFKEISMTLYNLARLHSVQNDTHKARELHLECLKIDEDLDRKPGIAWNMLRLGQLEASLGLETSAIERLNKANILFSEMGVDKYSTEISTLLSVLTTTKNGEKNEKSV